MTKARPKKKSNKRRVTFSLEAPNAKEVMVAGNFNAWNAKSHPMKQGESGVWKKALMLPPARYEYKFMVDGQWRNDPKNEQICANSFGTQNNVLIIS